MAHYWNCIIFVRLEFRDLEGDGDILFWMKFDGEFLIDTALHLNGDFKEFSVGKIESH